MTEDHQTEPDAQPPVVPPIVPPPKSGTHKTTLAPPGPPAPPSPEPAPPAPAPPPPGPGPIDELVDELKAELAALRAELRERDERALHEARLELAQRYGGGLARPEYAVLLPAEDPRTDEGARKLGEWLAAHPELLRQPPPAPAPAPPKEQADQVALFGRPLQTAASWAKLEVVR